MYKYGIELEGFYEKNGIIEIPDSQLPTDGYPGLVELRTGIRDSLWDCYGEIVALRARLECLTKASLKFDICKHKYATEQLRELRRRHSEKRQADIQNIYGKNPKRTGNFVIASCQINISNCSRSEFTDSSGKFHHATYGLFDVPRIVRALDKEFAVEIRASMRQQGEYCIKGDRLEYRSLPNFCFYCANFVPRAYKAIIGK